MLSPNYRHLKSDVQRGVLVLAPLDGELRTEEVVARLREEMFAAVAGAGVKKVVLDLQNVRYVSSAGFQPLILLRRHLLDGGGAMVLCGLSPVLAEVFRVTRLVSTGASPGQFESASDAAAAVALLAG